MPLARKWKCAFCDREFTRETWFKRHACEKKKRFMQAHSISAQKAYRLFSHWQTRTGLTRRGRPKTMEEFCRSPLYNTFARLVEFTNENYVVSTFTYLDWLVETAVPDYKWTDTRTVELFLTDYRAYQVPGEQAKATAENIKHWCGTQGYALKEFFDVVKPSQVLDMVREARLSPWVLFSYAPALKMVERLDDDAFFRLDEYVNAQHWIDEIESHPEDKAAVLACMEATFGS